MLYEEHVRNLRLVVKHLISFVTIDTEKYQTQASDDVYHPEIMRILQNFQANVQRVTGILNLRNWFEKINKGRKMP